MQCLSQLMTAWSLQPISFSRSVISSLMTLFQVCTTDILTSCLFRGIFAISLVFGSMLWQYGIIVLLHDQAGTQAKSAARWNLFLKCLCFLRTVLDFVRVRLSLNFAGSPLKKEHISRMAHIALTNMRDVCSMKCRIIVQKAAQLGDQSPIFADMLETLDS